MTLIERLIADRDSARRGRDDQVATSLLVTLSAEASRVGKDAGNRATTDDEAIAVVRKFIKNIEQSLPDLERFGRDTAPALRELEILRAYLPAGIPIAEVRAAVRQVIAANPDKAEQVRQRQSNAGWFVGQVMKATGGKADAKVVGEVVGEEIGA